MQAGASEAEASLQKLSRAGTEFLGRLAFSFGESRAAFDRANQAASDAFTRVGQYGEANKPSGAAPR